jgi:isopenicillin-N N-acyltransferase like protein
MLPNRIGISLLIVCLLPSFLCAEEKTFKIPYPEAKHGKGELRIVNDIPVLVVEGTPEEMGEQFGHLAALPAKPLLGKVDEFAKSIKIDKILPYILKAAGGMYPQFPKDYQKELDVVVKTIDVEKNLVIFANCAPDLRKLGGCSTIIVEPSRSKTKAPIFGRNLDWPPMDGLAEHSLVVVYRGKGKHACACITIPPLLGCISGMNDAGLSITINEISKTKDGSPNFNAEGVPMLLLFRQILESCKTVDEAEKMLKDSKRTTYWCLTVCDKKGGCVFEVTPKNVVRRSGIDGVCCCTNHFITDELSVSKTCWRYPLLEKIQKGDDKLGVEEVGQALHKVAQSAWTIQTMVFEPESRILHLAYAGKPASGKALKKLELGVLFEKGFGK